MNHDQFPAAGEAVELADTELAAVNGGNLFDSIYKHVVKPLVHAITHRNEPEPGQPFGKDPTYHPPVEDYVPPHRWV
ncbi:MAG: hypothetical protein ABW217_01305 [Polyangiaceae bacterium]